MVDRDRTYLQVARFGPFKLSTSERLLERDGRHIKLGGRAFDILVVLIDHAGQVVSHRDLIRRVWPNVVVEDTNLRVHITSLRKALGDGLDGARYIANFPRRGYSFVAPIERCEVEHQPPTRIESDLPTSFIHLPRVIGRDKDVCALSSLLMSQRFVCLVGPGGIGKTTVAMAVAHSLAGYFLGAVVFVDLAALTDGEFVASAVATALGVQCPAPDPVTSLIGALIGRRVLIVLDTCEHVVSAASDLAERVYQASEGVHLLATSREALQSEGEHTYLLPPLETPPDQDDFGVADIFGSPAVRLFIDRADASGHSAVISDEDAFTVADICRGLDGLPLGIELVASRVGTYGIRGTASLLNDPSVLLSQSRRTIQSRHRTLHATVNWSYELLCERDRLVFRRLAVFAGAFTSDAAMTIANDDVVSRSDVADAIGSLVDKSLVSVRPVDGSPHYRLLDTTRNFARGFLAKHPEANAISGRHAVYFSDDLGSRQKLRDFDGGNYRRYVPQLDNVRNALEWCFSPSGDVALGVELASRAAPFFLSLSLLRECHHWCERGLRALSPSDRGTNKELALQQGLAISAMFARGNSNEVLGAIERGLYLAKTLGEREHQIHLLAGLHIYRTHIGDLHGALTVAEQSAAVADAMDTLWPLTASNFMLGNAYHMVGDQLKAQDYCERALKRIDSSGESHVEFFGHSLRVRTLVVLSRAAWLRGYPDRATRYGTEAIKRAEERNHPLDLCVALVCATTILLWRGDLGDAGLMIQRLLTHVSRFALEPYRAIGFALQGELAIDRGEAHAGVDLLRQALATLDATRLNTLNGAFYRALADGLLQSGAIEEATRVVDRTLTRVRESGAGFHIADLLRVRAALLTNGPAKNLDLAEMMLQESLRVARSQSALSLELRAAIDLTRLWSRKDPSRGRQLLQAVRDRFSEGTTTHDLRAADNLLTT
jgi:predicted ATPase/DNA-binding winged helix-turn-helix (wHTH) protein